MVNPDIMLKRPIGSNADEWYSFIEQYVESRANGSGTGLEFVAVQIAEALDAAESRYMSAVKGRQEFRHALTEERKKHKNTIPYGLPENTTLWATKIASVAIEQNWIVGNFSAIISEIQKEAFEAGINEGNYREFNL